MDMGQAESSTWRTAQKFAERRPRPLRGAGPATRQMRTPPPWRTSLEGFVECDNNNIVKMKMFVGKEGSLLTKNCNFNYLFLRKIFVKLFLFSLTFPKCRFTIIFYRQCRCVNADSFTALQLWRDAVGDGGNWAAA